MCISRGQPLPCVERVLTAVLTVGGARLDCSYFLGIAHIPRPSHSASGLQNIRIFDTRHGPKPQLTVEAHTADVNVLSWNTLTAYMLASGGDDGFLRVWDLRAMSSHVASLNYHKQPICGIEWCPQESSMLATCSEVRCCQLFVASIPASLVLGLLPWCFSLLRWCFSLSPRFRHRWCLDCYPRER